MGYDVQQGQAETALNRHCDHESHLRYGDHASGRLYRRLSQHYQIAKAL
jgi:hypothetical protein